MSGSYLFSSSPHLFDYCSVTDAKESPVPEEIWMLISAEHRGYLPGWDKGPNTDQIGCFKSTTQTKKLFQIQPPLTGKFGVRGDNAWSLLRCTWQRSFWCGSILCKLIYTMVMKKILIHLISTSFPSFLSVLALRTWRHSPPGYLVGPRNSYLFYRKWSRRHWNNSYSVLLSRPWCSGCSFEILELK